MVRIDSHQHFWRYTRQDYGWIDDSMARLRRDFLPADLRPVLDAAGIAGCLAVQVRQTVEETRWMLELAAHYPWIRGVVGWVDLCSRDVGQQLAEFADNPRLVGVRHIAQAETDPRFLVSEPFLRGMAVLAQHDLVYDVLVFPHQMPSAIELAQRFPHQRFVLDHLGKPDLRGGDLAAWTALVQQLARFTNVSCKLSGMVTEAHWRSWTPAVLEPAFRVALDSFGPQRLLFGSDWPVCLSAADYPRWLDTVLSWLAPLPAAEQHAILGNNAARCYRLPG